MSTPTNVKLVNNIDEITKILQKFLKFQTKIDIVQHGEDNEVSVSAEVKNVNVITREIYLRPLENKSFNMDHKITIIFSNEFGNIEFEAKAGDFIKKTIAKFRFPSSIRIENLRSSQRMYLEEKNLDADVSIEGNGSERIVVIDLSNTGIGLKCDKDNNPYKSGDNVSINRVGKKKFDPALEAKVVYTREASGEEGEVFLKIGVQFNEPLEEVESVIGSL